MEPYGLIKSWRVFEWTPDDLVWLEEQRIRYQVATNHIPIAVGNSVTYIKGDMGISIETDTPEQETLLRLKFEPNIVLMIQEIVLPGSMRECTLSELKF